MNALQEFIDTKGMTLSEAAKLAGTDPVNLHRHYHGHRGISAGMALRYHRAFGIPLEALLEPAPSPAQPDEAAHAQGVA